MADIKKETSVGDERRQQSEEERVRWNGNSARFFATKYEKVLYMPLAY